MDFGTIRAAVFATAAFATLAGCTEYLPGPSDVPRMGVRSFFDIRHLCSLGVSPPIELDNSPGPGRYRIRMTNVSVLYSLAADYEVEFDGERLPEGALDGYRGICPGEAQSFNIRIEAAALDANNRTMSYGFTIISANSTTRLMKLRPELRPRMPRRPGS